MLDYERDMTAPVSARSTAKDLAGALPIGIFHGAERPEYTGMYADMCERAKGKLNA